MNLHTFATLAPRLYASGTALEIVSGPGVGKSSIAREIASTMSRLLNCPFGLSTQILSQQDPVDIKGFCIPVKDPTNPTVMEARFTRPSVFPSRHNVDVFIDGEFVPDYAGPTPAAGVLFLDEFGQSSVETQKVAAQLILEGRIGEYQLPAGWRVWSASNRLSDKSGVNRRLSFVQNRMKTIQIQADYEVWADWANSAKVHPLSITFARRFPQHVFISEVPAEPGPYCTPRSLVLLTRDLEAMRTEEHGDMRLPDDTVAMEVAVGWIGEKCSIDFLTHLRLANDLPEWEAVVKRPLETKVPERVDAQFVMANMLAHHAKESNTGPMLKYLGRMAVDMQLLFVVSAMKVNPKVAAASEFVTWISKNSELIRAAHTA